MLALNRGFLHHGSETVGWGELSIKTSVIVAVPCGNHGVCGPGQAGVGCRAIKCDFCAQCDGI